MSRLFLGASDKISFVASTKLARAVTSTMTWGAWVYKTVDDASARRIIDPNGSASQGFIIQTPNGDFNISVNYSTTGANAVYANALNNDTWTHLAFTWSVANLRPSLFINGLPVTATGGADKSGTQASWATVTALIGNRAGNDRVFSGRICEFAVWDRVLGNSEIATLGDGYSPRFIPNGLIMYFPLIGRNNPEYDLIRGVAGTLTGTKKADHPRIIYPNTSS